MNSLPALKTRVEKHTQRWTVTCPCGFTWKTRHHRLAILIATEHAHQDTA